MKPSEYLDKCKIALAVKSDYALAKQLKVSTQRIADYYKGKAWPDAYACARIAEALKLDPMEVLADIEAQCAKTEERREFWRGFIGRTKRGGAGLLVALCLLSSYMIAPSDSGAAVAAAASAALLLLNRRLRIMYIMLSFVVIGIMGITALVVRKPRTSPQHFGFSG